jgi:hypothetical protein
LIIATHRETTAALCTFYLKYITFDLESHLVLPIFKTPSPGLEIRFFAPDFIGFHHIRLAIEVFAFFFHNDEIPEFYFSRETLFSAHCAAFGLSIYHMATRRFVK